MVLAMRPGGDDAVTAHQMILAMDVRSMRHRRRAQPHRGGAGGGALLRQRRRRRRVSAWCRLRPAPVVQPPSSNREDILAAIDRFQLQRNGVGSGILVALKTLFLDAEPDLRASRAPPGLRAPRRWMRSPNRTRTQSVRRCRWLVQRGSHHPAHRRTDTTGPDPIRPHAWRPTGRARLRWESARPAES